MSEYKEKFGDGSIKYNVEQNRWEYEINGKRGHRNSLNAARQAIDDASVVEKKFERHSALYSEKYYNDGRPTPVTVTSYEEGRYSNDMEVWTSFKEGNKIVRKRLHLHHIFEDTAGNHEKFAEIIKLNDQIEVLEKQKHKLHDSLTAYKLRKQ
jgi:hypothetical protein